MKKKLALILAAVVALSSASGCGAETTSEPGIESSTTSDNSAEISVGSDTENKGDFNLGEVMFTQYEGEDRNTVGFFLDNMLYGHFCVDAFHRKEVVTVDESLDIEIAPSSEYGFKFAGAGHTVDGEAEKAAAFYLELRNGGKVIPAENVSAIETVESYNINITAIACVLNESLVGADRMTPNIEVDFMVERQGNKEKLRVGMDYEKLVELIGEGVELKDGENTYYVYKTAAYTLAIEHSVYETDGKSEDLVKTIILIKNGIEPAEETTEAESTTPPVEEDEPQDLLNMTMRESGFTVRDGVLIESAVKIGGGSIEIPDGVISIGESAFQKHGEYLTGISIPDSVTTIGDNAFYGCTNLTEITIPDSVTAIGNNAFYKCSGLTAVIIPDSVTSIGNEAFNHCMNLTDITFSSSLTHIGTDAFYFTGWMSNYLKNNGSPVIINGIIIDYMGDDTDLTLPDNVTSIGASAFNNCNSLINVTIPDSVTSISDEAFYGCDDLSSVTIPDSVTYIGENAFSYCKNLTSVTYKGKTYSFENIEDLYNAINA